MKKTRLKQGTLAWEKARETRIGGSEVFDIVRYYATAEELQNCGINAESFRAEQPFSTAWQLYHKVLADGLYRREALSPELAEYGHAAEPYGVYVLQKGRKRKLKAGEVYISSRAIASLDVSGIAEEQDETETFAACGGSPKAGQRFVCEQKTMLPQKVRGGVPFKYIVQAQYQLLNTGADFFIIQIMVLKNDSAFLRGKVCQMSRQKRYAFLSENMIVQNIYFRHNEHLARLIEECLKRFFADVDERREPTPFLESESRRNVIESIRLNSRFNAEMVCDYDLSRYGQAKQLESEAERLKTDEMQKIIETAIKHNACRFRSPDGTSALFDKGGRFLLRTGKEGSI